MSLILKQKINYAPTCLLVVSGFTDDFSITKVSFSSCYKKILSQICHKLVIESNPSQKFTYAICSDKLIAKKYVTNTSLKPILVMNFSQILFFLVMLQDLLAHKKLKGLNSSPTPKEKERREINLNRR